MSKRRRKRKRRREGVWKLKAVRTRKRGRVERRITLGVIYELGKARDSWLPVLQIYNDSSVNLQQESFQPLQRKSKNDSRRKTPLDTQQMEEDEEEGRGRGRGRGRKGEENGKRETITGNTRKHKEKL